MEKVELFVGKLKSKSREKQALTRINPKTSLKEWKTVLITE